MLTGVTFTGADDSVKVSELVGLAREWPQVEWGILFSMRNEGGWRFPSEDWVNELASSGGSEMRLAAHLCGRWVREMVVKGNYNWKEKGYASMFKRVQLNFHTEDHGKLEGLIGVLERGEEGREIIMQCDGVHDGLVKTIEGKWHGQVVPLFDLSGGAGIVPQEWPRAWRGVKNGYAGGLGHENIGKELARIREAVGEEDFWIDMERKVRSEDDREFNLRKVRSVLEQLEGEWGK